MKFLRCLEIEEKKNNLDFEVMEDFIYKRIKSGNCFLKLEIELEKGDDDQYPLESILDLFNIAVESNDFDNEIEFVGDLSDMKRLKDCVGKRVFEEYHNGYFRLVFESLKGSGKDS